MKEQWEANALLWLLNTTDEFCWANKPREIERTNNCHRNAMQVMRLNNDDYDDDEHQNNNEQHQNEAATRRALETSLAPRRLCVIRLWPGTFDAHIITKCLGLFYLVLAISNASQCNAPKERTFRTSNEIIAQHTKSLFVRRCLHIECMASLPVFLFLCLYFSSAQMWIVSLCCGWCCDDLFVCLLVSVAILNS